MASMQNWGGFQSGKPWPRFMEEWRAERGENSCQTVGEDRPFRRVDSWKDGFVGGVVDLSSLLVVVVD